MTNRIVFSGLPERPSTTPYEDTRRVVSHLLNGKMNIVGTCTLSAGTNETEIYDRNAGENSFIWFLGIDENSKTGDLYRKSIDPLNRKFTVGHDNSSVDRNYLYVVIG